ncbi:hypothetical protein ABBQ32_002751 [Trebouxia sp. C0010 RCD-2024]
MTKRSVQKLCRTICEATGNVVRSETSVVSSLGGNSLEIFPFGVESCTSMGREGKTPKRQAAEAFLHSRFTQADLTSPLHEPPSKRRNISTSAHVFACSNSAVLPCSVGDWCDFDVSLPHVNWNVIASSPLEEVSNLASPPYFRLPKYQLPQGIDIYVVNTESQLPEALRLLADSMEDSVISIDLEWKPDFMRDTSKVALMQLSSATCCLLIRTCKLGHEFPAQLLKFLRDPQHIALGFSWGSGDEKKMQKSFGIGREQLFGRFLDLQMVSQGLGYQQMGLTRLTETVLGCPNHKSKKVSMSNWEARTLTSQQIKYAALDALLTGQVFRGLRLWHSAPSACPRSAPLSSFAFAVTVTFTLDWTKQKPSRASFALFVE